MAEPLPRAGGGQEGGRPGERVLAVLGGSAGSAALLDCAATLAGALQRELALVQVQSTLALQAAALPDTQALAHAGAAWAPFAPADLERAWRAEATRLRALAEPLARRQGLHWSLRSVRGELSDVARSLQADADVLFVAAASAAAPSLLSPTPGRLLAHALAVLDDGSRSANRALQLAERMAAGASRARQVWRVRRRPVAAEALDELLRGPPTADLLVLPRALVTPARWARLARLASLGCPVLLVD